MAPTRQIPPTYSHSLPAYLCFPLPAKFPGFDFGFHTFLRLLSLMQMVSLGQKKMYLRMAMPSSLFPPIVYKSLPGTVESSTFLTPSNTLSQPSHTFPAIISQCVFWILTKTQSCGHNRGQGIPWRSPCL